MGPVPVPTVYFIFYGTQWTANDKALLSTFGSGLASSNWMKITASYPNSVASSYTFGGSVDSNYALSTSLGDSDISGIVSKAIANGLPSSGSAVYIVLTSKEEIQLIASVPVQLRQQFLQTIISVWMLWRASLLMRSLKSSATQN